jgi:hypothetical protein
MRLTLAALLVAFASPAGAQIIAADALPLMPPPPHETTRIGVTVFPGLASNAGLPDRLRAARQAMHRGETLPPETLRELADRRDGLAAQRYVDWLRVDAGSPTDIATYAAIAAGTGRIALLDDFIAALYHLDPATEPAERTSLYMTVLYAHAWEGNLLALDAVVDLNGDDRLFGALSERTRDRIFAADTAHAPGRGALRLALSLLSTEHRSLAQEALLDAALAHAAASGHPGNSAIAVSLLARRPPGVGSQDGDR